MPALGVAGSLFAAGALEPRLARIIIFSRLDDQTACSAKAMPAGRQPAGGIQREARNSDVSINARAPSVSCAKLLQNNCGPLGLWLAERVR